jgi:Fe2+ or Zn2+ uptake regulation protein
MKNMEQRLLWATTSCRHAQMRLTPVRKAILSFLARRRLPATLEKISQADGVRGQCDATTVYRTLMMFKEANLVRLVGTLRKVSCFVLNVPGDAIHLLICQHCDSITELPLPAAVSAEIERIASTQGFSSRPPDCEVYGLCASCQATHNTQVMPSKLIVGAAGKVASSKRDSLE